jgi:NAD(P)-dependent dehydrogenase (short-subunit alcohol dehydrogenase family)
LRFARPWSRPIEADLRGKTAIVTGATAGIGKEVARELARLGARLVLPCRDAARGRAAVADIRPAGADESGFLVEEADLSSQASIRAFADRFLAAHPRLDILVNNAGVWMQRRETTVDGIERTFATNVLAYHLLTSLLLERIRASAPARIVNVASKLASGLDLEDLEYTRRPFDGIRAYAQSKQANRMLSWALAERLAGTKVTVNAVHPGGVRTSLGRELRGFTGLLIRAFFFVVGRSPREGADTVAWVAASPEVEGVTGKFWQDRREQPCRFRDPAAIAALWDRCEALTRPR